MSVIYSIHLLLSAAPISKPITSENKVYDKIIKVLYLDVGLQQGEDTIELTNAYVPEKVGEYGIVQDAIRKYTTNTGIELSDGATIVNQQIAISDKAMKFEPFYHSMVTDATKLILPHTEKTSEELGTLWDKYVDRNYERFLVPDLAYGDQDLVYNVFPRMILKFTFGTLKLNRDCA